MIQHAIAALFTVCLILLLSGSIAVGNGGMDDWGDRSPALPAEAVPESVLASDRTVVESGTAPFTPWPALLLIGLFGFAFWTYPYLGTRTSTTNAHKDNVPNRMS